MSQPQPFERTLRSLATDRYRRAVVWSLVAAALLVAWGAWLTLARLPVYAASRTARIEVAGDPHAVEAQVDGRVVAVAVRAGARVEAGEVLFEIDAGSEGRRLEEERARVAGLETQVAGAREEWARRAAARDEERTSATAELAEARARLGAAESAAALAEQEAARAERLSSEGLSTGAEVERLRSLAEQRRAEAEAAARAVERQAATQAAEASVREAELAAADREVVRLETEVAAARQVVERLGQEVERRTVRAPVAGVVGEVAVLQAGSQVEAGEHLATLIPDAGLRVVASFAPAAALGRVAAGQPAEVRLDGFPWTEFGTLVATVERVAAEPRDDGVRVDLLLAADQSFSAPLRHGLPGTVLVEVERTSPFSLVLRAAGHRRAVEAASSP